MKTKYSSQTDVDDTLMTKGTENLNSKRRREERGSVEHYVTKPRI